MDVIAIKAVDFARRKMCSIEQYFRFRDERRSIVVGAIRGSGVDGTNADRRHGWDANLRRLGHGGEQTDEEGGGAYGETYANNRFRPDWFRRWVAP